MLDPVLIHYAKGTLTGFPMDTNAVFDVVSEPICIFYFIVVNNQKDLKLFHYMGV